MATRKTPPRKRGATTSRKRSQSSAPQRRLPGWLWAAAGLAAGFLLAHHQNGTAPWQDERSPIAAVLPKPSSSGQGSGAEGSGKADSGSEEAPMPTFEFYTLLPDTEVIASDTEIPASTAQRPEAAKPPEDDEGISENDPIAALISANASPSSSNSNSGNTTTTPAQASNDSGKRYMLQAASFREMEDANSLASRLQGFGLQAKISDVSVTGGATWHRVQVGPYNDRRELARAQDLMSTQGIEPLLIQLQN
ncbi:SPOR domain-containing protein [Halomonas cupida]|uniref:Sporulation related domain-containing protein n=1 Tax=Halomonas cupida TaxID=44933 RepID=A0A1M7MA79_9GAMM|nr:SPOR domain-containing protein [Halomonas cupida]GEN25735.1 hypothetical protein HCU01_36840 [Halomonas cupida]SHM87669.1 Sporulation related domain-containing protein [Halomonas cupida]